MSIRTPKGPETENLDKITNVEDLQRAIRDFIHSADFSSIDDINMGVYGSPVYAVEVTALDGSKETKSLSMLDCILVLHFSGQSDIFESIKEKAGVVLTTDAYVQIALEAANKQGKVLQNYKVFAKEIGLVTNEDLNENAGLVTNEDFDENAWLSERGVWPEDESGIKLPTLSIDQGSNPSDPGFSLGVDAPMDDDVLSSTPDGTVDASSPEDFRGQVSEDTGQETSTRETRPPGSFKLRAVTAAALLTALAATTFFSNKDNNYQNNVATQSGPASPDSSTPPVEDGGIDSGVDAGLPLDQGVNDGDAAAENTTADGGTDVAVDNGVDADTDGGVDADTPTDQEIKNDETNNAETVTAVEATPAPSGPILMESQEEINETETTKSLGKLGFKATISDSYIIATKLEKIPVIPRDASNNFTNLEKIDYSKINNYDTVVIDPKGNAYSFSIANTEVEPTIKNTYESPLILSLTKDQEYVFDERAKTLTLEKLKDYNINHTIGSDDKIYISKSSDKMPKLKQGEHLEHESETSDWEKFMKSESLYAILDWNTGELYLAHPTE